MPQPVLSALTINIWNRQGPWAARKKRLRAEIARLDAEVVALQEVIEPGGANTAGPSQAAELAQGLGYRYAFGPARPLGDGFGYGNALLSKYPISGHHTVALPGAEEDEPRSVLVASVAHPQGALPVLVTHLSWRFEHGFVREQQVVAIAGLLDGISRSEGMLPALVMGDLNAQPDAAEIRFLLGLQSLQGRSCYLADCYGEVGAAPGYTFDEQRNPFAAAWHERPRRIDYVLVRGPDTRGFGKPMKAALAFTEVSDNIAPSDHFGVYAEIAL